MRIIEKKKLNEEFTELSEFDNLDDCIKKIIKMYKEWEKNSKYVSDDEWDEYGFKSFKEAKYACKEEIIDWIKISLEKEKV